MSECSCVCEYLQVHFMRNHALHEQGIIRVLKIYREYYLKRLHRAMLVVHTSVSKV